MTTSSWASIPNAVFPAAPAKEPAVWEQTTLEGLANVATREIKTIRNLIASQRRFWEDDLPELMRAIDSLPVDLAELGHRGEHFLKCIDALEDAQGKAYMAQLDSVSKLEDLLDDLHHVESEAASNQGQGWRREMMEELYGTKY